MIQWPSILPAGKGAAMPEPVVLAVDIASGQDGIRLEFPQLAPDGESSVEASPNSAASGEAAAAAPARSRWNAAALAASLVFHVVAIAGFGALISQVGMEAETDAISVAIVADPEPEPSDVASVAGDANETRDEAALADRPEPEAQDAENQADVTEAPVAVTRETASTDPVAPAPLPQFQPLSPLTEMEIAPPAPDAAATPESGAEADLAAAMPDVSPPAASSTEGAAMSRDDVGEPASDEPLETGETDDANAAAPVLAARPSLESMLPAIAVPRPPLFLPVVPPEPAAAPAKTADAPKITKPVPVETDRKPAAKAASVERKAEPTRSAKAQEQPRKAEMKPSMRAGKPEGRERGGPAPAGGAKAKDKSRPASQAGSVASAAASSGDRDSYGRKVSGHVQRYKRYPDVAARGGIKGAVKVSISIGGSGNLASARVIASSGHPVLDSEALATVRRAAPYPKPPASFGGTARFSLTLRYSK